jgi:hypothetical protein
MGRDKEAREESVQLRSTRATMLRNSKSCSFNITASSVIVTLNTCSHRREVRLRFNKATLRPGNWCVTLHNVVDPPNTLTEAAQRYKPQSVTDANPGRA